MLKDDFDKLVDGQLARCKETLCVKGAEYANESYRLHNFQVASEMNGVAMSTACWGMATKHIVSIIDIVRGAEQGSHVKASMLDEKITDAMNYLMLLKACLEYEGLVDL